MAFFALPRNASAADYRLRISRSSGTSTAQTNASSYYPALSSDGRYVAFQSYASNIATGGGSSANIYFLDRRSGHVRCLSTGVGATAANGYSFAPAIDRVGSVVAFSTSASNITASDDNGALDVVAVKTSKGTASVVSASTGGAVGNGDSYSAAVSGNGRWVAFVSSASNFDADTLGYDDVFMKDLSTGALVRVSNGTGGSLPNGSSAAPSVSYDGRYVAFSSTATNLVRSDTNKAVDVFVFDRLTKTTERVSVTNTERQANLGSFAPSISSDAKRIAFESLATNLVSGDTNAVRDVFVRDRSAGTTTRASVGSKGQGNGESAEPSISSDGRRIAFTSLATNLVGNDTNGRSDVFVRNTSDGTTKRLSQYGGYSAKGTSSGCSISSDGLHAAFQSDAANLVSADTNVQPDIFVASWGSRTVTRINYSSVYDISANASSRAYPKGAKTVVIASASRWYEALPAASLAGAADAPLLYATSTSLASKVASEVARLKPQTVYLIGSSANSGVRAKLQSVLSTATYVTLTGKDRYELSSAVASEAIRLEGADYQGRVLVASGTSYYASLAAAPLAFAGGVPVVLVDPSTGRYTLPAAAKRAQLLGNSNVISTGVEASLKRRLGTRSVGRLQGTDRYSTASAVAAWGVSALHSTWERLTVVNGSRPAEAICAGVMAGRMGGVVLVTAPTSLPKPTASRLSSNATRVETVYIAGSSSLVNSTAYSGITKALGR